MKVITFCVSKFIYLFLIPYKLSRPCLGSFETLVIKGKFKLITCDLSFFRKLEALLGR